MSREPPREVPVHSQPPHHCSTRESRLRRKEIPRTGLDARRHVLSIRHNSVSYSQLSPASERQRCTHTSLLTGRLSRQRCACSFGVRFRAIIWPRLHSFAWSLTDLNDPHIVRNLSESATRTAIHNAFIKELNSLTSLPTGSTSVVSLIKFSDIRPFETARRNYFFSAKSIFDKVVCDNDDELLFATFLEHKAQNVAS